MKILVVFMRGIACNSKHFVERSVIDWKIPLFLINMPQEFQVLRCFSCEKFQVHQTKKARKWNCKVCGEKQSLKKAFFIGSAQECRPVVQELNMKDGMRKQNLPLNQFHDEAEENDYFSSDLGNIDQSGKDEQQSSENEDSCETFHEPSTEFIPRKKQRCDSYLEPEICIKPNDFSQASEDFGFLNDSNQEDFLQRAKAIQDKSATSQSTSFDVDFGTERQTPCTKEATSSVNTMSSVKIERDSLIPSKSAARKPCVPKNRGFQMILKAAQNLSS